MSTFRTAASSVAAVALGAGLLLAGPASADSIPTRSVPSHAHPDFTAQARKAGLTGAQARELQTRVDEYLARMGGTQVAANRIDLKGGDIVVAVPGEKYTRDLNTPAVAHPHDACPYGDFCMFTGTGFTGSQFNLYTCGTYDLSNWNGNGSYDNNQTPGTAAKMLDRNYNVIDTTPGAYWLQSTYDWTPVWHVVPC